MALDLIQLFAYFRNGCLSRLVRYRLLVLACTSEWFRSYHIRTDVREFSIRSRTVDLGAHPFRAGRLAAASWALCER